jgi:hypothetical protein
MDQAVKGIRPGSQSPTEQPSRRWRCNTGSSVAKGGRVRLPSQPWVGVRTLPHAAGVIADKDDNL